jgi:hypothetical protein
LRSAGAVICASARAIPLCDRSHHLVVPTCQSASTTLSFSEKGRCDFTNDRRSDYLRPDGKGDDAFAKHIENLKSGWFKPEKFEGHYQTELIDLIKQKRAGKTIRPKRAAEGKERRRRRGRRGEGFQSSSRRSRAISL